jgi:hypothetical protein
MNWPDVAVALIEFMDANFAAIVAVVASLGAAILSGHYVLRRERLSRETELERERQELQREYYEERLYKPVMTFLDETLETVNKAYRALQYLPPDPSSAEPYIDRVEALAQRAIIVRTRIVAHGSPHLVQAFDEFSKHSALFSAALHASEMSHMTEEMAKLEGCAATVLRRIAPQAPEV